jgi:sialic acid synthase SpsE
MSGNHNQSLERALAIVGAAAEAGAHALKLQTYTADTMTLDLSKGAFFIDDRNSLWKGTEKGMRIHFFKLEEINEIFNCFSEIRVGFTRFSQKLIDPV